MEQDESLKVQIIRAVVVTVLVLAGLAADGLSIIVSCRHIQRGYEDLCRDLGSLGAEICWL